MRYVSDIRLGVLQMRENEITLRKCPSAAMSTPNDLLSQKVRHYLA